MEDSNRDESLPRAPVMPPLPDILTDDNTPLMSESEMKAMQQAAQEAIADEIESDDSSEDEGKAKDASSGKQESPSSIMKPSDGERKKEALVEEARAMLSSLLQAVDRDRKNGDLDQTVTFSRNPLKAFGDSDSVTVEKFMSSGGMRSVVVAVAKYSHSGDVVDFACKGMLAFTLYDNHSVKEMIRLGATSVVIQAIEAQAEGDHATASVSALKMLRNLTQTPEQRVQIYENKGIQAIVLTMQHRNDDARCTSHAALVLSNLAFGNAEIKEAIGEHGGIEAIATAMKAHSDHQPIQARGALALRNLCYGSEENQEVAGPAGAAEALIRAVKNYPKDREVAHQACVALANMSNVNEDNRFHIAKADGANVIVNLMKKHKDSATVNDDCITIIRNMCVGNETAAVTVGSLGGVEAVIHAMRTFPKDATMLEKACAAVRHLCFVEQNRDRVALDHGFEAIIMSLKENLRSQAAVENALLAIGNASFGSSDNKAIVGKCGGVPTIIEAVEGLRQSPDIQEHGCRVLRNLSDGQEFNRRIAADSGAVNTAVFAMMGYPDSPSVQEQALALLLNISMSDANMGRLQDADAARLAEKALNLHPKHRGVSLQAGQLIQRLDGYGYEDSSQGGARGAREEPARRGLKGLLGRKRR